MLLVILLCVSVVSAVGEGPCGGEDGTHVCMNGPDINNVLFDTGDVACGERECLGIELSAHNIEAAPMQWVPADWDCGTRMSEIQYLFFTRAICGEEIVEEVVAFLKGGH